MAMRIVAFRANVLGGNRLGVSVQGVNVSKVYVL